MDDCSREWTYRTEGGRLTITHEGGSEITFDKAILQRADISWSMQHLDRYSLSVCLYKQTVYNFDFIGAGADFKSNIGAGYEQCTFHKLTGWGNFLRINNGLPWGNPTSGGGGPIE